VIPIKFGGPPRRSVQRRCQATNLATQRRPLHFHFFDGDMFHKRVMSPSPAKIETVERRLAAKVKWHCIPSCLTMFHHQNSSIYNIKLSSLLPYTHQWPNTACILFKCRGTQVQHRNPIHSTCFLRPHHTVTCNWYLIGLRVTCFVLVYLCRSFVGPCRAKIALNDTPNHLAKLCS